MRSMSKIIGQNVDYSGVSRIGEIWYIIVSVFLAGFFFAVIVGEWLRFLLVATHLSA